MRITVLPLLLAATSVIADAPEVRDVILDRAGATWRVSVTLAHPDTGWDHYADGWRVEDKNGTILGTRELLHPHVTEQPFTRSLSGVAIPDGATSVFIRAKCSVDGWNETVTEVTLP